MQEQTFNGAYKKPEPLTDKKLKEALRRISGESTKRLLIFASKDSHGRPTKEMKRAWRRYSRMKEV
ncbi:hypothetical protein ES707_20138 [subsurface metagenome]